MKRLKKRTKKAKAPPPPEPEEEPEDIEEEEEAEEEEEEAPPPKPKKRRGRKPKAEKQLPAIPADLLELFSKPIHEDVPAMGGGSSNWLSFYHSKKSAAADIRKAIGSCSVGRPFCSVSDTYYALDNAAFFLLDELPFWQAMDDDNDRVFCSLERQDFGAKYDNDGEQVRIKESFLAMLLVVGDLDDELQPGFIVVSEFNGPQSPCIRRMANEIKVASTPDWAKKNGALANVPPRMRIVGTFQPEPRSKGKRTWANVDANCEPISVAQMQALAEWMQDEAAQEEKVAHEEIFAKRADMIRADAAAHDETG